MKYLNGDLNFEKDNTVFFFFHRAYFSIECIKLTDMVR